MLLNRLNIFFRNWECVALSGFPIKGRVRSGKLTDAKTLSSRGTGDSEDVPIEHIQNFIQHLINIFSKYLNKEPL